MKIKNNSPICEHCGYNENIPNYPHQLPMGTVLMGQYLVGKVLGQGGFGITYMGWDQNLDVPVAIKEYFPNGFVNRECTRSLSVTCGDENRALFHHNRERFIREAKALARLRDVPGIVRIHNFFQENATAYIVMEYVEGIDLKRYMRMQGRTMTAAEVLHILKPMMEALSKVHDAELVHRDISPDNIMILPNGSAKLLDFGAVREVLDADTDKNLSQATEAILKQGFAPMEQYQNRGSLGPWTDVYALCATMYYCMTGKVPPDAPARLLENRELNWNAVPGLNQRQIAALERGMALMPKQRTASIRELYNELYGITPEPAPQSSVLQNDFRNAYQNSGYSNDIPKVSPEPISNTGRNPVNPYPNHTIPLDANPISGYQAVPPVQHLNGYQAPATPTPPVQQGQKKPSKKGLIIGIAAAALAAVVGLSMLGKKEPASVSGNTDTPSVQVPVSIPTATPSAPESTDALLAQSPTATYTYRNGWRLDAYYDNKDQERARLFYNGEGQLEYKSIAEYHSSGELENHWLYDGDGNLIRQETYTLDSDGDIQSYVRMDGDGKVLEAGSYQYDSKDNLTSITYQAEDGTVLRSRISTYDSKGNELTRIWNYRDGSWSEFTYNENGDNDTQHSYDSKGKLKYYWEYEFDANGRRLGSTWYDANGDLESTSKNTFDQNDNVISTIYYDPNGTVSYTWENTLIGDGIQPASTYIGSSYNSRTEYEYLEDIANTSLLQFEHHTGEYSNYDTTTHYDILGNQLSSVSYNFDGSLYSTSEYSYDAYGTKLGHTYTSYNSDGSYNFYKYDENYECIGSERYDENGKLESWTEYEFDANGNRSKELSYNADGSLSSDRVYTYDANGNLTKSVYTGYSEDGSRYVSISDGDYNTLESMNYDANGNRTYYRSYKYDFNDFGKPDVQYCYDENGKLKSWTEYTYDENGNYLDSEYVYGKLEIQ